jgi:hypothetical protein
MTARLKARESAVMSLSADARLLKEQLETLQEEADMMRAALSTSASQRHSHKSREKGPYEPPHQKHDGSEAATESGRASLVVFDASQIPVELTSSLQDLNDVFSALGESSAGQELVSSLFKREASATTPTEVSIDTPMRSPKLRPGALKNLVRAALASPNRLTKK